MPRLLFALLFSALIPLCAAIDNPVPLESGKISGLPGVNADVRVFKGIPYAASPVGNLRWRAPSPAPHWDGVRTADKFSAACMQTEYPEGSLYRTAALTMSEDCLYLNVWTAAKSASERRPVMLWIHDGGLTRGMGTNIAYDGEELAKKGVVLVTINYRLGVFGYFSHPELTRESDRNASGAYGFLDQIAALQWVRQNIAAFGGDPARVTIFGESAGAWSVNALVSSPLAKGLFSRAIAESGGNFGTLQTLADAEKAGARLGSLRDLRAMSAQELLRKGPALAPKVVDGWFLPQDIYTTFATGKQNDVPVLLGSNADEGTAFTPLDVTLEAFRARAKQQFGDRADEFLKIYSAANDKEAWKEQCASLRDQMFGWQMRTWARMQTKTGKSKVYLYYFSRVPPGPEKERYGTYHASEIVYAFHNLHLSKRATWEDADRKLSDAMSSYWVNFAKTGNPNGQGLAQWPEYREKSDTAINLGDKIEPIPIPHKIALDFLDKTRGQF